MTVDCLHHSVSGAPCWFATATLPGFSWLRAPQMCSPMCPLQATYLSNLLFKTPTCCGINDTFVSHLLDPDQTSHLNAGGMGPAQLSECLRPPRPRLGVGPTASSSSCRHRELPAPLHRPLLLIRGLGALPPLFFLNDDIIIRAVFICQVFVSLNSLL